ncbi:helix-turn-helix transcriptional regulator [Mangrovibacterium lignilyticum]|uniref:helix-turn-helix transcriptional regulator n=1 Tax=Mangrovibacterium lignilyticum TaxID=2668052 RepID=UPI0013D4548F|nr:WYL domain-containing protein [Mangrovibacterium lignilyticum]
MSKHGTIRRYTLEIEKIRQSLYPSFIEIKEYLSQHGFEIGDRTLQRDIEQIRFEFGIEIKYGRDRNGYYIDYENSLNTESFFRFLEIVNTAELLTESLLQSKDTLKYISFDTGGGLKGIENLKPLLKAIKEQRKISFSHLNFHTKKTRKYTLKPYLLKEYLNRWYVVGIIGGFTDFRTFGIDRIENLDVKAETFVLDEKLNPAEAFNQTIGLVYSENSVQNVVLSFTPTQGKYIKTLPLHSSQKLLVDNDNECRISIDVIPNYELTQQILKYGDTIRVLTPDWLANEIKQNLKRTIQKYG